VGEDCRFVGEGSFSFVVDSLVDRDLRLWEGYSRSLGDAIEEKRVSVAVKERRDNKTNVDVGVTACSSVVNVEVTVAASPASV
jgi:hypothetical protein